MMDSPEVKNTVNASEAKQSPAWHQADYWGLLRRFTPRNDSPWEFLTGFQP
jgi:hypothetical protein